MSELSRKAYESMAAVSSALASPLRIELLELLAQGPRTVDRLAAMTSLSSSGASQHLKTLRAAGLVRSSKSRQFVTYELADEGVLTLLLALRAQAEERVAGLRAAKDRTIRENDAFESVDRFTLLNRVAEGRAVVLDVRPHEEYEAAHFPGAISIPLGELRERLRQLPSDQQIVAYCRGPFCSWSAEAVHILKAAGFEALRTDDGVVEWQSAGVALERKGQKERTERT